MSLLLGPGVGNVFIFAVFCFFLVYYNLGQGWQHYPACCQGFPVSLAVPGTVIWHQIEGGLRAEITLRFIFDNLEVAGGMGCPCEVTLAIAGVWQRAGLSCHLLAANGSL